MLINYFRIAFRNLARHKGYAAINILGLTLGLAAFCLIAFYIADELSYDRYHQKAGRIFRVVQRASWEGNNIKLAPTSAPFAPALKAAFPGIEETVRIDLEGGGVISFNDKQIKVNDIIVADQSFFNVFTHDFIAGNAATALADPTAVVLSETLAKKIFGSADNALNQTVNFDKNYPAKVTGVIKDVPANSHMRFSGIRPLPANYTDGWQSFHLYTYILLNNKTNHKDIEKQLPRFAANTIQKEMGVKDYHMELQPLTSIHLHSNLDFEASSNGNISKVYLFMAIALLILVIAMINYMNLATARASARVKEVGIRKTIGAGKWGLMGLFICEAVVITLLAGLLSLVVIQFALPYFNQLTGKELSIWRFGKMTILLGLLGFSMTVGVISGLYPSLVMSRFKTIPSLKGQLGSFGLNILFRKSLVVFQFVITIIMITGSIVIYRQLKFAMNKDLGLNKDQVVTFHIDDRTLRQQVPVIKAQLLKNPLIQAVATAGNPVGNNDLGGQGFMFEKNDGTFAENTTMTQELLVDQDFLNTLDIKLTAGRNFSEAMPSDQYGAAVINETLARDRGWTNPIGKRMKFTINKTLTFERTVVGVVKDFHTYSLQHKVEPLVMLMPPEETDKDNFYVKLAKGKTTEALAYLQAVYSKFDNKNPVEYHFLDKNFANQYVSEQRQGQMALIFAMLAVVIACLGLFGLATFTAAQRRKEIGIRKVLGASVPGIVGILSKEYVRLVLVAAIIAFPVAWWAMRQWLNDFAYRINISAWIFVIAGIIALLIAMITVSFQAIKAALANPVKNLRNE